MNSIYINLIISLLFFTLIIGIVIFIQFKLSRSQNKYLGLIMPIISFILSILIVAGMTSFTVLTLDTTTTIQSIAEDGIEEKLEETAEVTENLNKDTLTSGTVIGIFFTFLAINIPTVILGGIYLSERNKITVQKSIEKMKINDL